MTSTSGERKLGMFTTGGNSGRIPWNEVTKKGVALVVSRSGIGLRLKSCSRYFSYLLY